MYYFIIFLNFIRKFSNFSMEYSKEEKNCTNTIKIIEEISLRKCNISDNEISFHQIIILGKAISETVIMKLLKFMEDEI